MKWIIGLMCAMLAVPVFTQAQCTIPLPVSPQRIAVDTDTIPLIKRDWNQIKEEGGIWLPRHCLRRQIVLKIRVGETTTPSWWCKYWKVAGWSFTPPLKQGVIICYCGSGEDVLRSILQEEEAIFVGVKETIFIVFTPWEEFVDFFWKNDEETYDLKTGGETYLLLPLFDFMVAEVR